MLIILEESVELHKTVLESSRAPRAESRSPVVHGVFTRRGAVRVTIEPIGSETRRLGALHRIAESCVQG